MSEGPSKKGPHKGVTVTTVRRPVPRASQGSTTSKGKRRSRPSVRYREKMGGTATPGGDFCTDDEVGKMLDDRILEMLVTVVHANSEDLLCALVMTRQQTSTMCLSVGYLCAYRPIEMEKTSDCQG